MVFLLFLCVCEDCISDEDTIETGQILIHTSSTFVTINTAPEYGLEAFDYHVAPDVVGPQCQSRGHPIGHRLSRGGLSL